MCVCVCVYVCVCVCVCVCCVKNAASLPPTLPPPPPPYRKYKNIKYTRDVHAQNRFSPTRLPSHTHILYPIQIKIFLLQFNLHFMHALRVYLNCSKPTIHYSPCRFAFQRITTIQDCSYHFPLTHDLPNLSPHTIHLFFFFNLCIFIQGRWQPTQSQLIQIYSVDWTYVYDTPNIEHRTSKPLKYQRTTNTTATLVVKY